MECTEETRDRHAEHGSRVSVGWKRQTSPGRQFLEVVRLESRPPEPGRGSLASAPGSGDVSGPADGRCRAPAGLRE